MRFFLNVNDIFYVILLIYVPVLGWGQYYEKEPINIKVGPEIRLNKKEVVDKIIGKDADGFYVMARYSEEITFFYYQNDLTLRRSASQKLQYQGKKLNYRGVIQMGGEFFVFSTYTNTKEKRTQLFGHRLNKSRLILETPIELASESYDGYRRSQSASFSFKVSSDSTKLLFITDLPSSDRNISRYGFLVLDEFLSEVWRSQTVTVNETENDFYRYDSQVGNDGSVYVLAQVVDNQGRYKRKEINYRFEMHLFKPGAKNADVFNVSLQGHFMSDMSFEVMENKDIKVVGFYSSKRGMQDGIFNVMIDGGTHDKKSEKVQNFPIDFIVQHSSDKEKRKAKRMEEKGKEVSFFSYNIDELVEHPDGRLTMVGEQFRYYEACNTDAHGQRYCTYHYVYGNIIVVNFNTEGEVDWMELVPKYQHTTNDRGYYSSYALAQLSNGTIHLVFNDSPKNSYYEENGKLYGWKRSSSKTDIVLFSINEKGETTRQILARGDDEDVMSRPRVSVQIDENQMLILAEDRRIAKFFKLEFDLEEED